MAKVIQTQTLLPGARLSDNHASWIYNGLDCCITTEVFETLFVQQDSQTGGTYELSRNLQGPVLEMALGGLRVNHARRDSLVADIDETVTKLRESLDEIIRDGYDYEPFNIGSPQKLQEFFYDYLKLPVKRKRNSHGRMVPTVDRDALERLNEHYIAAPVINHILTIRDLTKRKQFLTKPLSADGRMRTSFNIAGTNTGRLSSAHDDFGDGDNLQNVDRKAREMYIAGNGNMFVNLDLEQADSRNVGAACWNKFLESHGPEFAGAYLDACESGDLHTTVTRMAWSELDWGDDPAGWRAIADGVAYRDYSYRDLAKRLGHGSNYYGMAQTMAKHSKLPVSVATEFQHKYFTAFPCIREGHRWTIDFLQRHGYLDTIWGRRRYFFSRLNDDRTHRTAIAYEGQSATADEINHGIIRLWRALEQFPNTTLRIQVHDSVLIETPRECVPDLVPIALEALRVPLILKGGREFVVPTEAKVGSNWGDKSETNPNGLSKWRPT